jgi:hypothetical protein
LHARGGGIGCGGKCFGHHLVGFVDGAFDTGGDDGLAREPLFVFDADVGGEDDRIGLGDGRRRQRRASRRPLRLHVQRRARLLGCGDQRVGGHVRVRDACWACGDRDQRLGLRGFGCGLGLFGRRVDNTVDQLDHFVGAGGLAQ